MLQTPGIKRLAGVGAHLPLLRSFAQVVAAARLQDLSQDNALHPSSSAFTPRAYGRFDCCLLRLNNSGYTKALITVTHFLHVGSVTGAQYTSGSFAGALVILGAAADIC